MILNVLKNPARYIYTYDVNYIIQKAKYPFFSSSHCLVCHLYSKVFLWEVYFVVLVGLQALQSNNLTYNITNTCLAESRKTQGKVEP